MLKSASKDVTAELFLTLWYSASHAYIYNNNVSKGQYQCRIYGLTFSESNNATKPLVFKYPYWGNTFIIYKERKHFKIHRYVNKKFSYYLDIKKAS